MQECLLSEWQCVQATLLITFGLIFIVKELDELVLLTLRSGYRRGKKGRKSSRYCCNGRLRQYFSLFGNGLKAYVCSAENVLQMIFSVVMIIVCSLVFDGEITVYKIGLAAVSSPLMADFFTHN